MANLDTSNPTLWHSSLSSISFSCILLVPMATIRSFWIRLVRRQHLVTRSCYHLTSNQDWIWSWTLSMDDFCSLHWFDYRSFHLGNHGWCSRKKIVFQHHLVLGWCLWYRWRWCSIFRWFGWYLGCFGNRSWWVETKETGESSPRRLEEVSFECSSRSPLFFLSHPISLLSSSLTPQVVTFQSMECYSWNLFQVPINTCWLFFQSSGLSVNCSPVWSLGLSLPITLVQTTRPMFHLSELPIQLTLPVWKRITWVGDILSTLWVLSLLFSS